MFGYNYKYQNNNHLNNRNNCNRIYSGNININNFRKNTNLMKSFSTCNINNNTKDNSQILKPINYLNPIKNYQYKNRYDKSFEQKKKEKIVYRNVLLEQIKLNEMKKKIELQNKKRQDILDELKLMKQRKEIELQNQIDKNKRYEKIVNRFAYDNNLLEKQLIESEKQLNNYESNVFNNKQLIKSNSTYFNTKLSLEEKLNIEKRKAKLFESHLFNKEILNDIESLKLRNNVSLDILNKELYEAKKETCLSERYKDILLRDLNEIKNEMKLKEIDSKYVSNYIKEKYIHKKNKKNFYEQEKKLNKLPVIDYNKDLVFEDENVNKTYLNAFNNNNDENDDLNQKINVWEIMQKNEMRLKDLSFIEERDKIN